VPRAGEFGNDTWPVEAWKHAVASRLVALSVDLDRGIVFLPLTSPATDSYGWDRERNLLVILWLRRCQHGKRLSAFQVLHHDIWDYDLPAQPVRFEPQKNGELVMRGTSNQTGSRLCSIAPLCPLFPIEEVAVPKSWYPRGSRADTAAPLKPPPFAVNNDGR